MIRLHIPMMATELKNGTKMIWHMVKHGLWEILLEH